VISALKRGGVWNVSSDVSRRNPIKPQTCVITVNGENESGAERGGTVRKATESSNGAKSESRGTFQFVTSSHQKGNFLRSTGKGNDYHPRLHAQEKGGRRSVFPTPLDLKTVNAGGTNIGNRISEKNREKPKKELNGLNPVS